MGRGLWLFWPFLEQAVLKLSEMGEAVAELLLAQLSRDAEQEWTSLLLPALKDIGLPLVLSRLQGGSRDYPWE